MTLTRELRQTGILFLVLLCASLLVFGGNQRHAQAQVPGVPGVPVGGKDLVEDILEEVPQDSGTPVEGEDIICDDVDPTLEDNDVPNFDCDDGDNNGGGDDDDDDDDDNGGGDDDDDDTPPADNSGSSGGGGGGGGGGSHGQVLGVATDTSISCDLYLTEFIRFGGNNNPEQVIRLQSFLNIYEGTTLQESGVYDQATLDALKAFQAKNATEILAPWGITQPTGFVYLTTRKRVNEIRCNRLFPLSASEWQTIQDTRARAGGTSETAPVGVLAPAQGPSFVPGVQLPAQPAAVELAGGEDSDEGRTDRGGFWNSFWDWLTGRSR